MNIEEENTHFRIIDSEYSNRESVWYLWMIQAKPNF